MDDDLNVVVHYKEMYGLVEKSVFLSVRVPAN